MIIQHNIMAMNAYRNYMNNTSALSKNLEKLSSGYKINRAGDDAAGLAISEKMRAQITGLDAAQKNVQDGISLVQTAEGAMQEVQDMLNRMVYLATQSANGTYDSDVDRANLQKEVDALSDEINRIADSANFNGIKLLDGSLEDGATGIGATATAITIAAKAADQTDPTAGTILKSPTVTAGKTSFDVELHNVSLTANDGDTFKLTIGSDDITLTVGTADEVAAGTAQLTAGTVTGTQIATAAAAALNKTPGTTNKIDGELFTVTASGAKLSFVQANNPAGDDNVVQANQQVSLSFTSAAADSSVDLTNKITSMVAVAGTDATYVAGSNSLGANLDTNLTMTDSSFNETALLAAANELNKDGNGAISATWNGTNKTIDLVLDGIVIASSQEITTEGQTLSQNEELALNFKSKQGTPVELGTITLKNTNAADYDVTSISSKATNLVTENGTPDTTATISYGSDANIKAAVEAKGVSADADLKIVYANSKYQLMAGDTLIAEGTFATNKVTFKDGGGNTLVELDGTTGTVTTAQFQTALATAKDLGVDYKGASAAGKRDGTWNIATTNNVQGAVAGAAQEASTFFALTADMVKDGNAITIGQDTYTFAVGKDSKVDTSGAKVIDLKAFEAGDAKLIDAAGAKLTEKFAASNSGQFTLGYNEDNDNLTVREVGTQTKYTTELQSVEEFQKLFSFGTAGTTGKGLILQIGDTSDPYNQLSVNVEDMHVDALGIGDISILDQDSAAKAVNKIKEAINSVSMTRGTLGATQNRLEHTANNLSVMEENIQDAESAIRDTDIAEEMMAYTKNNILIQSAQAMLAQANMVPQGVLQLLQ